ncbi:MAG: hypothetical protein A2Z37_15860, partial [Chloroflexi bacterium RBG_19FT_COMBO_62_14]
MDIGVALSFVTQDKDWIKKILIGAVLVLTGIGMIPVLGWGLEVTRRVIRGDTELLPEWTEFGKFIMDGLKLMVGALVWSLPLAILAGCLVGIPAALSGSQTESSAATISLVSSVCLGLIALPYFILYGLLLPGMAGVLADKGSLGMALNPMNSWKLVRANVGGYVIAFLVGSIIVSVATFVGTLVCVIGLFPATAYAYGVLG